MTTVPDWYAEIEADEALIDARIREQSKPARSYEVDRPCPISFRGYGPCTLLYGHDGICEVAARTPRIPCLVCGLSHREVCPSGPGVADILSAPTPEPVDYSLPACER